MTWEETTPIARRAKEVPQAASNPRTVFQLLIYVWIQRFLAVLSIAALLTGIVFCFIGIGNGAHTERTCQDILLTSQQGSVQSLCLSTHLIHEWGCSALPSQECLNLFEPDLPPGCKLP